MNCDESFDDILLGTEERYDKAIEVLTHDFRRLRTGRASVSMIEHVQVDAYGSRCPITQVAGISVPEPTQILIKPWDKGVLKDIERSLIASDLGMSPQNDGNVIRLNVPTLSEERRKQLASQARDLAEKCRIAMRNVRRDGIKSVEALGKDKHLPEDSTKAAAEQISDTLKTYEGKVDEMLKAKIDDLTTM